MRKRILSIILAASMMLALTPNTVMAAKMDGESLQILETAEKMGTADSSSDMEGLGTEASPYRIKNAEQLRSFADMVNGVDGAPNTGLCAVLTCSIDLSGVCGADIGSWTPIGTNANPYTGIFDGGSYAITGLYYHKSNSSYAGLFGSNAGIIKNLEIVSADVAAGNYAGGVCGYNNGTRTGCYNAASVKGAKYTGGICGYNDGIGTISICYNTGSINGSKYVGGICGYNNNTASNCYNMGAINGDTTSIGGICGYNSMLVSNCFNTGTVNGGGKKYIGSVCGYNHSQSSFLNCYYLITGEEKGNYGVGMSQEQFASGEVCWLLNEGKSENVVWHQTCGAGFPAFGGKVVYQVRRPKTGGSADEMIVAYTNEEEKEQASNNASVEENDSENTDGHVYQEPKWEWKEYKSAKAVFTCQNCGEKSSLEAAISTKTTEATCGKEGKTVYTASVDKDGETYTDKKTVKLEKPAHRPLVQIPAQEATCTEAGIKRVCWECPDCGEYFADQERTKVLSRKEVVEPAKGHKYSLQRWDWDVENNPLVAVAIFSCDNVCGTIEKENGKVTSETKAACATAGEIKYTAVVKFNRTTYKEERTVSGKPIPHSYGDPKWNWAKDFSTATATFTCKKCSDTVTENATITPKTTNPTCTKAGKIEYKAVVTFGGKEYQCPDLKTESIDKLPHSYGKPATSDWQWSKDYISASVKLTCNNCGTSVTKTATVTKVETTGTDCGKPGTITYTAVVTLDDGTTCEDKQEKDLPATHTLDPVEAKAPTCVDSGNEKYWKCSVCLKLFGDEEGSKEITSIPDILPKGHTLKHVADDLYECTECNKKFTVSIMPDGTPTMYSLEEDAVIPQDETENLEETQEDTEVQFEDEQDGEPGQSEPEGQNEETSQSEPEGENEQNMQNEQDEQSGPDEDENSGSIPDVSENAARYGLIYPEGEGEKTNSVTADAWEESAINLRAESARNGAAQTVQAQQQQGYPLWVSATVLAVLAGMVMFFILRRKDNR